MRLRLEAERVEDGRRHVNRLDEALLDAAARGIGLRRGVVEQEGHALDAVVEQLLLAEPVVAQIVAMVGGEDHHACPSSGRSAPAAPRCGRDARQSG